MRKLKMLGLSLLLLCSIFLTRCCSKGRWENLPVKIKIYNQGQQEIIDFYNRQFMKPIFENSTDEDAVDVIADSEIFKEKGATGYTDWKFDSTCEFIVWGEVRLMRSNGYDFFDSSKTKEGKIIFAHELMHLIGYFDHDSDPTSLMYYKEGESNDNLEILFQPHLKEWLKETYNL